VPRSGSGPRPVSLPVIWVSLAAGVALFAVVLLAVRPEPAVEDATLFRVVWLVLAVGVALAAGALRSRAGASGADEGQWQTTAIVVWALAEGQALLGLVGYMLSGDRLLFYLPLVFFVWLWLRYPPRAFRSRSG
jgi:F0F1-type ATP synthase membrane subunit c/vacuolar-type H+-ATPase subunit K